MMKAGFPVPEGFIVVVDAYRRFVSDNKIDVGIEHFLHTLNCDDYEKVISASHKIQNLFKQAKIPFDIVAEIDRTYDQIGYWEVAVRSSATAEDLSDTSFAGQYHTLT